MRIASMWPESSCVPREKGIKGQALAHEYLKHGWLRHCLNHATGSIPRGWEIFSWNKSEKFVSTFSTGKWWLSFYRKRRSRAFALLIIAFRSRKAGNQTKHVVWGSQAMSGGLTTETHRSENGLCIFVVLSRLSIVCWCLTCQELRPMVIRWPCEISRINFKSGM